MNFNFNIKTLETLLPVHRWEVAGSDIYGAYLHSGHARKSIVRVKDIDELKPDQSWDYYIYNVDEFDENILMSEQVKGLEPVAKMFGNFSYLGKKAYMFMRDDVDDDEIHKKLPLVVAIVGESGSGKTALSIELAKYGISNIVSYTTRPMRPGETNGVEHWFVSEDEMPDRSRMLAYTYFGNHHYWADIRDIQDCDAVTYVIDESGLLDLYDMKKADKIDVLYVKIIRPDNPTDEDRKSRDVCREEALQEIERRGIKPDAVIMNDYATLEEFLDKEAKELGEYIRFITLKDMFQWEKK